MDALGAEVLCPGHGVPIWGAAAVHRALDDTASLLESLVDQVLALMNRGARLDEVLATRARARRAAGAAVPGARSTTSPSSSSATCTGCTAAGGTATRRTSSRRATRRSRDELAALAGGAPALAARAEALAAAGGDGDLALACHLVELATAAAPGDAAIRAARAAIYARAGRRPSGR